MSDKRQRLGSSGEDLAADYLHNAGYTVLHRNYRCRSGEIDIIARHRSTLVFLEVKTRASARFGTPAAAVTWRKQQQISRVALEYLSRNDLLDSPARFDVIAIIDNGIGEPHITHIPNAFELAGNGF